MEVVGDLTHMLIVCPGLKSTRDGLIHFLLMKSQCCPPLYQIVINILNSPPHVQTQFLLDPCHIPAVSDLCITMGPDMLSHVYYLTRTYAYYMHRAKMLSLGRWPGDPGRKPKPTPNKSATPRNNDHLICNFNNACVAGSVADQNLNAVPVSTHNALVQYNRAR